MKQLFAIPFLFACSLLFFACNSDDNVEPLQEEGIMEVTLDDEEFTITSFTNTLIKEEQFGEAGRRLDLRGKTDEGTLIISIANWDWQNPPEDGVLTKYYDTTDEAVHAECKQEPDATYCDSGLVTYIVGSTVTYISGFNEEEEGFIEITLCDEDKKLVSGRFETIIEDIINKKQIQVKGTFKKVPYSVF